MLGGCLRCQGTTLAEALNLGWKRQVLGTSQGWVLRSSVTNLPSRLGSIVLFRCTYPLLASVLKLKHLPSINTCFLKLCFRLLVTKDIWPVKLSHGEAAKFACLLAGAPDGFSVYQEGPQIHRLPLITTRAHTFSCCLPHHGRLFTLCVQFLLVSLRVKNSA